MDQGRNERRKGQHTGRLHRERRVLTQYAKQVLACWYHWTLPPEFAQRRVSDVRSRQAQMRLTSLIILVLSLLSCSLLLLGGPGLLPRQMLPLGVLLTGALVGAIWLLRQNKPLAAGTLLVALIDGAGVFLLMARPAGLGSTEVGDLDGFVTAVVGAACLFPASGVFGVALGNSVLILALLWLPRLLAGQTGLIPAEILSLFWQPLLLHILVAVFCFLLKRTAQLRLEQERQANKQKDQILLTINHEVRTPLMALMGYLELLQCHYEEYDQQMQNAFFTHAFTSCLQLSDLIETMMEAVVAPSKEQSGPLEVVSLFLIIQDVLARCDPSEVKAYRFQVQVAEDLLVCVNTQWLRRIVRNLLSNIFKYCPRQTLVRIDAHPYAQAESGAQGLNPLICLSIQDSGPGIAPEDIPLLFERFVRLQRQEERSVKGIGLGLFICRQLVEAMGGQIWVESSGISGQGACFFLTLPGILEDAPR